MPGSTKDNEMRKILLLLSVVLTPLCGYSQCLHGNVLIVNKAETDGSRHIVTGYQEIFTSGIRAGCASLICEVKKTDTIYAISLSLNEGKLYISEGRKLIIKLENDSIITLENETEIGSLEQRTTEYGFTIVEPFYLISYNDLYTIINIGVKKIRIETNTSVIDRIIKKNKMSIALKIELETIQKELATYKDLYSDF